MTSTLDSWALRRGEADQIDEEHGHDLGAGPLQIAAALHQLVDHIGREIARQIRPLALRLAELALESLALGQVAQDRREQPALGQRHLGHRKLDGNEAAVGAQPLHLGHAVEDPLFARRQIVPHARADVPGADARG